MAHCESCRTHAYGLIREGSEIITRPRMLAASTTGRDLATLKSVLSQGLLKLPPLTSILVVGDNDQDAMHIAALMHLLLGRKVQVNRFKLVATAIFGIQKEMPNLVVVDDFIPPADRAESSIGSFRRFGYTGPIIVVSGMLTNERRREIAKLEPLAMMHKDEIDSFSVTEVLLRLVVSD